MERVCAFSFEDPTLSTTSSTPSSSSSSSSFLSVPAPHTSAPTKRRPSFSQEVASCVKSLQLMTFDAVPAWMRDNRFILSGYRVNWGWKHSFRSMWKLHNETLNVWTHFLGFLGITLALFMTISTMSPHGIDHVHWEWATNSTCLATSVSAWQPRPPMTPWNPNGTTVPILVHEHESVHLHSINDLVDEWGHHIPFMAKVTRSLKDQMESLQDTISTESEKFAHLQTEFQRNARLKFNRYVASLDESFQSFKRGMNELKADTEEVALENYHAAQKFLSSFRASLSGGSKLDVMAFARVLVQDFKEKHGTQHNGTDDAHGFPVLPLPRFASSDSVQPYLSRWPLAVFMVSAMACLLFSAIFHLFTSVSEEASLMLQSLDFAGICLLTAGSNIPVLYYGFYCSPAIKWTYISIELVLGLVGFVITSAPQFRAIKYRTLRAAVFITLGLSGVGPFIHLLLYHGEILFILWYLLLMGFFYLFGAFIYTFHIPECYYPGRFDIFFSSHQLWHVCVFLAVCTHYVGLVEFYTWRMGRVCGNGQW